MTLFVSVQHVSPQCSIPDTRSGMHGVHYAIPACRWQQHRQTVLVAMLVLMAVASMLGPGTQPILGPPLDYKIDTAWEWLLFQSTVQACASMPVVLRVRSTLRCASTLRRHAPHTTALVLASSLLSCTTALVPAI